MEFLLKIKVMEPTWAWTVSDVSSRADCRSGLYWIWEVGLLT